MRKYLYIILLNLINSIILLIGVCLAQKKAVATKSKEVIIQIGAIDEFVLSQGYPFKKQSVYGKIIIQQGRLDEFVLNQGYPFKRKSDSVGSHFKIIVNY